MSKVISYSNPATEGAITFQTLDDGTLVIDAPPVDLTRMLDQQGRIKPLAFAFVGASILLPVLGTFIYWLHSGETKPLFFSIGGVVLTGPFLLFVIGMLVVNAGTRRVMLRVTADHLSIEQVSRFEGRTIHNWPRESISKIEVKKVQYGDEMREAVCIFRGDEMKYFLSDRKKPEIDQVAVAIQQIMNLD